MNFKKDIKTVGFKDMHPDQVASFVALTDVLLRLAEQFEDERVFEHALGTADDAVVLFGGMGIEVINETSY